MSGSFNLIQYGKTGRVGLVRRITLSRAIREAESFSRQDKFNYASVRRLPDGKCVGLAVRGEFRFDA